MIYRLLAILGKKLQKNENLDLAPKDQALLVRGESSWEHFHTREDSSSTFLASMKIYSKF